MKIIIYATHSFGTFETLKKHPDVVVVGYGTKWQGYLEKAKVIHAYLQTLPPNEIVAVVDGFDSYILKTNGLEEEFLSMNCKILVSKDAIIGGRYMTTRIFGTCKNNYIANAGLIMGYAKELTMLYEILIHGESSDDQRNLNKACKDLPFLKIDTQQIIFKNCSTMEEVSNSSAYICQRPGTISPSRIFRAIGEYTHYFIPEILFILFIIFSIVYRRKIMKMIKKIT